MDEAFINRCIELAYNGLGTTYPNPLVGSVVVYEGRIIGEGWHQRSGEGHAEVRAIASVKEKNLLPYSTLYVNLEPCCHYGKTPPCTELIIKHRIGRVVIGTTDPFAAVAGKGIDQLRAAGIAVTVGVCEAECLELNKRFFTYHNRQRPYIFLKWAQSSDGFIAPAHKDEVAPHWISCAEARQYAHLMRSREQAILVGVNTVIADNPSLDTREWYGHNPLRVIIDPYLRSPKNFKVWNDLQPTLFLADKQHCTFIAEKELKNTEVALIDFSADVLPQLCKVLYQKQIQSLIVEGGSYTLQEFIKNGLWDEAYIATGKTVLKEGVKTPYFSEGIKKEGATSYYQIYKNNKQRG